MGGFAGQAVVFLLKTFTFIYDLVTLPIYMLVQKPWSRKKKSKAVKAEVISREGGLTYKSLTPVTKMHKELKQNKIDTMEKVFSFAIKKNGHKRCLGTREVIAEEDEMQPNNRVFKKYVLGDYLWKSYNEVDRLSTAFSKGLLELGLKPKDKIAIFAETRAEWLIAAIACFKQNITIVTLYATLGDDAVVHGLNETEVKYVITSHDLMPKFRGILKETSEVHTIIYMEDPLKKTDTDGFKEDVKILAYCNVIANGGRSTKELNPPSCDDIAIVMYTSGSTGVPKGVLLSHKNIATAMMAFSDVLGDTQPGDCYIGFLPLAHVLELMCESVFFLSGVPVGYSTPLTLTDKSSKIKRGCKGDATVLQPTIMTAVPLILDRIYKGIQEKVQEGGPVGETVFKFFYDYKIRWFKRGYDTPIVNKLIFQKVRDTVGGHVRLMASGGAPLSPDTHEFIRTCLCAPLLQGYGLTETAACTTVSLATDMSIGRVGGPLECSFVRLVDWEEGNYRITDKPNPRGEVLIGGENVSMGYFKLPSATNEEFFVENGVRWFRSGDIGEVCPDGALKIIDRKKDLVKLQFGEYVSLGKVESEMKTSSLVENICIYADSTKLFTVALVVPADKQLRQIAEKLGRNGVTFEAMCIDSELEKAVLKELQDHGKKCKLEKFEIPGAVKLVSDVWSPDMGLVTAAFKLKRKNIQERYQSDINRMYAS